MILVLITSSSVFAAREDDEFLREVNRGNEAKALLMLSAGQLHDEKSGKKAFEYAIENNMRVLGRRLPERGVNGDIDQALIIAVMNGDERMVDMLLAKGANPNISLNFEVWGSLRRKNSTSGYTAAKMSILKFQRHSNLKDEAPRRSRIAVSLFQHGAKFKNLNNHELNSELNSALLTIWNEKNTEPLLYDRVAGAIPSEFHNIVLSDNYEWPFFFPGGSNAHKDLRARKIKLRFRGALADVIPLAHENRQAQYSEVQCNLNQNGLPPEIRRLVGRYTEPLPVLVGEDPVFIHRKKSSGKKC